MLNNGAVFITQTLTDKEVCWLCCCKNLSFFFEPLILKQWGKIQKITNCKRSTILAIESLQLVILLLHWFQTDIYLILYLTFQEFPVYFCHHNFFQLCFWTCCYMLLSQWLVHDAGDGFLSLSFQKSAMVSLNDMDCYLTITYLKGNTAVSQRPTFTRGQHYHSICYYFMLSRDHNIDSSASLVHLTVTASSTLCSTSLSL